jgi:hypothetical protein
MSGCPGSHRLQLLKLDFLPCGVLSHAVTLLYRQSLVRQIFFPFFVAKIRLSDPAENVDTGLK